jgi:hypothetical protein
VTLLRAEKQLAVLLRLLLFILEILLSGLPAVDS